MVGAPLRGSKAADLLTDVCAGKALTGIGAKDLAADIGTYCMADPITGEQVGYPAYQSLRTDYPGMSLQPMPHPAPDPTPIAPEGPKMRKSQHSCLNLTQPWGFSQGWPTVSWLRWLGSWPLEACAGRRRPAFMPAGSTALEGTRWDCRCWRLWLTSAVSSRDIS